MTLAILRKLFSENSTLILGEIWTKTNYDLVINNYDFAISIFKTTNLNKKMGKFV